MLIGFGKELNLSHRQSYRVKKGDCKGCKGFSTTLGNGDYRAFGNMVTTLTFKKP